MACIRLIHVAGEFLFEGLSVLDVGQSAGFKGVFLDEALHRGYRCLAFFNEAIRNKFAVDQSRINPGKLLLQAVNFGDSRIREYPRRAGIRASTGA